MKQYAQIKVPGLKVAVPLPIAAIPMDLVPPDGPAGEPAIELVLEGSDLAVLAKLNGKNFRKILRSIAENGPDNVFVVLQGTLRPPTAKGGPFILEGAGCQCNIKPATSTAANNNVTTPPTAQS